MRINVTLSDPQYEELRKTAQDADMDMSEFVRNAIRVYNYLQKERKEGRKVYIGENDKVEKELLLL